MRGWFDLALKASRVKVWRFSKNNLSSCKQVLEALFHFYFASKNTSERQQEYIRKWYVHLQIYNSKTGPVFLSKLYKTLQNPYKNPTISTISSSKLPREAVLREARAFGLVCFWWKGGGLFLEEKRGVAKQDIRKFYFVLDV